MKPLACLGLLLAVGGCASTTTVDLVPSPQAPVCDGAARALVLWAPQWRTDQKDVADREAAAADGLGRFVTTAGCFASATLQRAPGTAAERADFAAALAGTSQQTVVLITVRELGPTLRLGGSLALVEGATEVLLDVAVSTPAQPAPRRFTLRWRSGGPGVVKGVGSLADDLRAALAAGLQPAAR